MSPPTDTIVLVHGLWLTARSWEHWAARYESRGYRVLVPPWPGLEREVDELNRDPTPLERLDLRTIVEHYDTLVRGLDSPPILMGHSTGGSVVQVLLDRGLGAAGVGIASATVKGIRDLPLSTIRATAPALRNPFRRHKSGPLTPRQFHYAFTNTLTRAESDAVHARYHVPASNNVLFELAFANLMRRSPLTVDFARPGRRPLLLVAFEDDHVVPPKASRHNAEKYSGDGLTAFQEFPGRPHFPGAPGWEEVADYALSWATANTMSNGPLTASRGRLAVPEGATESLPTTRGAR